MSVGIGPRPAAGTVIAALLLPPLGIFLRYGLGMTFWVGVGLTLVGWVPGVVWAFVSLFRPDLLGRLGPG